jgi:hypothetical protein
MKILLCEFEVSVTKWVSGENAYRTRITAHEKRYLDETEVGAEGIYDAI